MPTLPLTQLDERALAADLDNRTFSLTFAQPVAVRDLLLLLVRGTSLSIVPDPAISGSFIGELKNVTVRQALGLILPPLGLDYTRRRRRSSACSGASRETRLFDINYSRRERDGAVDRRRRRRPREHRDACHEHDEDGRLRGSRQGVQTLLSERATFNVDRKAGLLQVTDFPERLDRVARSISMPCRTACSARCRSRRASSKSS